MMTNRRLRLLDNMESAPLVRIGALMYLFFSLITTVIMSVIWLTADHTGDFAVVSWMRYLTTAVPPLAIGLNLLGGAFIFLLVSKCRRCQSGPGQRITAAMEKMGKGDVGWKIVLRNGDELAPVANSVSRASQSLADRIVRLQSETRQLVEIEDLLQDSLAGDRTVSQHTLKALRRLKICTSRIKAEMEDFQVSVLSSRPNAKTLEHV